MIVVILIRIIIVLVVVMVTAVIVVVVWIMFKVKIEYCNRYGEGNGVKYVMVMIGKVNGNDYSNCNGKINGKG